MRSVYTRLVLGLALSLLPLTAAFAQAPATSPAASAPQVQIRMEFVTASAVDVDNLGLGLDRIPFPLPAVKPPPGGTSLQVLSGGLVPQFYQTLVRTRGKIVQAPLVLTPSGVTATIRVDKQVSFDVRGPWASGAPAPPPQTISVHLQTALFVTPRINSDGSVTLSLAPQIGDTNATATGPHVTILRTVSNGEVLVIAGLPINGDKPTGDQELLIFVTPTIVGTDAPKADGGQSAPHAPPLLDTPGGATKTVTLEVSAADLREVVALMTRQTGVKMSVLGAAGSYKRVFIHLADSSLAKALQVLAASAGAQVSRNAEGVYVFSPLPEAPVGK